MNDAHQDNDRDAAHLRELPSASRCIDWYSPGEERLVEVGGIQVAVGLVGRKGRRARIAITAPPGATFRTPTAAAPFNQKTVSGNGGMLACFSSDE
jgi:hypothetical protein